MQRNRIRKVKLSSQQGRQSYMWEMKIAVIKCQKMGGDRDINKLMTLGQGCLSESNEAVEHKKH